MDTSFSVIVAIVVNTRVIVTSHEESGHFF